ncbi:MAG: substrate-binding domain-containing protein [Lachnospiraceae bacterium]
MKKILKKLTKKQCLILLVFVIVFGCSIVIMVSFHQKVNALDVKQSEPIKEYQYHYVMIRDSATEVLWESIYQGAKSEGEKLDAYVEDFGSGLSEEYTTNELFEMAISAKVDGIMIKGNQSKEMKDLIDKAANAGIPTVTILEDVPESQRRSFVSANHYSLGELYGNQVKVTLEKRNQTTGKNNPKVSVLVDSTDTTAVPNLIYSGISETLSDNEEWVDISAFTIKNTENFEAEEMIRDLLIDDATRPDVLVCLSAVDTISAYQSIIDYNLVGKVSLIGYYSSTEILSGIQKGIIEATIAMNAQEMGSVGVTGLNEYVRNEYVSEYLPVAGELITKENIEQYIAEQKRK